MQDSVVQSPSSLRWWQYVGPWPLVPVAVGMTLWLSSTIYEIARTTASVAAVSVALYPPIITKALPASVIAGLVLWLFTRRSRTRVPSTGWYWLSLTVTVVVFIGVRFAMGLLPTEGFGGTDLVLFSAFVRTMLTVLFIQTVTGVTGYRLGVQVERTNDALRRVREQQELMLEADEERRAQVSMLLHDRVQAGLIAACLELQDCAERAEPQLRLEIADVVHRLEELRGLDVRRAARALSPDLGDTDLHSAIEDLAAQYSPSMHVTVTVAPRILAHATRPPKQLLLGAYRIIEQSLLNAAVHGRARTCVVEVSVDDDGMLVTIDDDGHGLTNAATQGGLGTALVTTWVRILDGAWVREALPAGGVRVRATLPFGRE